MNDATKTRSVNCTQCAAPLEIRGGHRVKSLVCGYCGAVLDTKDEYQVVKQFSDVQRPLMPLKLGMRGKIKNIEFTIIGVVQYNDGGGYRWLEYQVFSPTHGYHWLVFSDGHFSFSYRVREIPDMSFIQKTTFRAKDKVFKVYESYTAMVDFVEGELTYVAEVGDVISVTEGIAPPFGFSRSRTELEEEYSLSEYIPPEEIYDAFGVKDRPRRPYKVHPLQPYVASPFATSVSKVGIAFAMIAFVIALAIVLFGGGRQKIETIIEAGQLVSGAQTQKFTVTGNNSFMRLDLSSSQNNSWTYYDITVLKDEEPVASLGKQISYYHGVSGGESWREGSRSERVYFTLAEPGNYRFQIAAEGGHGERGGSMRDVPLRINLREDAVVSRYFFLLTLFFLLAAIFEPSRRWRFEARRWEPVLEDDDE